MTRQDPPALEKVEEVGKAQQSAAGSPQHGEAPQAPGAGRTWTPARSYFGLGLWNVFFICEFALAYTGYLRLDLLYNAILFVFVLLPVPGRALNALRQLAAVVLGIALVWSESWLPGPQSILANTSGIAGFSVNYVVQLLWDFINFRMVGWGVVILLAYYLLSDFVRITTVTALYMTFLVVQPIFMEPAAPVRAPAAAVAAGAGKTRSEILAEAASAQSGDAVAPSEEVENWYRTFLDYEKERMAQLPTGISARDTPFDIIILNICSLSNDDLEAANLQNHKVFSRFNIRFDKFNSATSYSGPAALRLLTGACGQPSHDDLYGARRPDCEVMNRLDALGFKQHLFLDHGGAYDNYLNTMRTQAGLTAPFEQRKFPLKYMSFNNEEIADTLSVLRHWMPVMDSDKDPRSVSLFNFIALHDGNRLPLHSRWEAFEPRAKRFLDDLNTFITELEKGRRKVLLLVVPEHGAAVRGDRIQTPRLRDIPSRRITQVPVLAKFIGLKDLPKNQIHVSGSTSYLALTTLIGRTIETNFFSKSAGAVPLEALVKDLPQTHMVSENGQAAVLEYKGRDYLRLNRGKWEPYGG